MRVELRRLSEVSIEEVLDLLNNPRIRRHMPLAGDFGPAAARDWIQAKDRIWDEHGYGPWAVLVDGGFAGWAGLQPEEGDADLAIVLHPDYWGIGKLVFDRIRTFAFDERGLTSITALLPLTRNHRHVLRRLGFDTDGEIDLEGEHFLRYRLHRPK